MDHFDYSLDCRRRQRFYGIGGAFPEFSRTIIKRHGIFRTAPEIFDRLEIFRPVIHGDPDFARRNTMNGHAVIEHTVNFLRHLQDVLVCYALVGKVFDGYFALNERGGNRPGYTELGVDDVTRRLLDFGGLRQAVAGLPADRRDLLYVVGVDLVLRSQAKNGIDEWMSKTAARIWFESDVDTFIHLPQVFRQYFRIVISPHIGVVNPTPPLNPLQRVPVPGNSFFRHQGGGHSRTGGKSGSHPLRDAPARPRPAALMERQAQRVNPFIFVELHYFSRHGSGSQAAKKRCRMKSRPERRAARPAGRTQPGIEVPAQGDRGDKILAVYVSHPFGGRKAGGYGDAADVYQRFGVTVIVVQGMHHRTVGLGGMRVFAASPHQKPERNQSG